MTPFDRHLQAAQGYLELGLPLEAHEVIESIEPEMRTLSEVLDVRVDIFDALGDVARASFKADLKRRGTGDEASRLPTGPALRTRP